VQVRQGKLNFTTMSDILEGASVLMGTFSINDILVNILFHSGATHSFISGSLVEKLNLNGSHVKDAFTIVPGWKNLFSHNSFGSSFKIGK
jgi:hypothetical protein